MPRLFMIASVLLCTTVADAGPPSDEQIRKWVQELDHPRYRVRDEATRNLREAGPVVLPLLIEPAKNGNAETTDRVMKILSDLSESSDATTEKAAKQTLRLLADQSTQIASVARGILDRRRLSYAVKLEELGAKLGRVDQRVKRIDLDQVLDMPAAMSLVKEFPEVEFLSASTKLFDDVAAKELIHLPNLNELYLFKSGIGDEALKTISQLKNLRTIPMGNTKVTDAGLKHLSVLHDLDYVGVRGNNVTDAGVQYLKPLTKLTGLNLAETKVTDQGMLILKSMPNLQSLYLDSTAITDKSLEVLVNLKQLESITLAKTKMTFEGKCKLRESIDGLRISDDERDYP